MPPSCPVSGKPLSGAATCPATAPAQEKDKILAIPGPVNLSPAVQAALALQPLSHVGPEFVKVMKEALGMTREVVGAAAPSAGGTSTPLLLAGSGTLGWDTVGANLVSRGKTRVLVLKTGYFGDGFRECLEAYGAHVTVLSSPSIGGTIEPVEVERVVRRAREEGEGRAYGIVTVTHVDTSTGVRVDVGAIASAIRRGSEDKNTKRASEAPLVVVDAVCSLGSEEMEMEAWGVDVVLGASQKGLGAPAGLCVVVLGERAVKTWEGIRRQGGGGGFYSSWDKWIPIMRAYDSGSPAYFATPAVNLVRAYHASLLEITRGPISMQQRLAMHREASAVIKRAGERAGLKQVCGVEGAGAWGMSAFWVDGDANGPSEDKNVNVNANGKGAPGMSATQIVQAASRRGVVLAGGLVAGAKDRYVRVGHMGWGVVGGRGDVEIVARVLGEAVGEVRRAKEKEVNGKGGRATAVL